MSAQQHAHLPRTTVSRRALLVAVATAVLAACGKKGKLRRKNEDEKKQ